MRKPQLGAMRHREKPNGEEDAEECYWGECVVLPEATLASWLPDDLLVHAWPDESRAFFSMHEDLGHGSIYPVEDWDSPIRGRS